MTPAELKEYLDNFVFCRRNIYWKNEETLHVSSQYEGFDLIIVCQQVFASQLQDKLDPLDIVFNTLNNETCNIEDDNVIQLRDGRFLNIIEEHAYSTTNAKRFIAHLSETRQPDINYNEFMNRTNHPTSRNESEQILKGDYHV
jgi:hypothetical protein